MIANFFSKSNIINTTSVVVGFTVIYYLLTLFKIIPFSWEVVPMFLVMFSIIGFINRKNDLTENNIFSFLFFALLLGSFPKTMIVDNHFYNNIILLLFLRKVYSLQSKKNTIKKIFDASLWIGVSFLIEPYSIIFISLLYLSIIVFNQISLRKFLISIIGSVIPLVFYFTYCYWFNETEKINRLFYWYSRYNFSIYNNSSFIFTSIFSSVLILFSIFLKSEKILRIIDPFRKKWTIIISHWLLAIILIIITDNKSGSELLYVMFPSSIMLTNGVEIFKEKIAADIMLILFSLNLLIPFLS